MSAEPNSQSRAASIVADAAEAAEDEPRASMIAAPRLATVGMKVFSIQSWSPTTSAALGLPSTNAWKRSGYCVAEWLPQIVMFVIAVTGAPVLAASWEIARLWSRRVSAENRSSGMSGALLLGDERVGVGGVAGDTDPHVVGGDRVEGLALRGEDRAVGGEQVAALHARAARPGADQQREVDPVEHLLGVRADLDLGELRERAVVELHDDALERLFQAARSPAAAGGWAVRGESAAREAEQQAVADLTGGAGDGDLQGGSAHDVLLSGKGWPNGR